jgi:PKD repeat protein
MATDSVQFTDTSTMSPSSWDWTFNGGTPSTSTQQNPLITYNTPGVYTVTLTATNINGSDTETKVNYITVNILQAPVADFAASLTNISAGESVDFTDLSANIPTSWSWTFEGGTPSGSTDQNPTVTYNTPGTYTVTLTATNSVGSDTETKVDYIDVAEKPYCASQGNTYSMEWIAGVQVGTMNNPSGAAGYTDFTSITCDLTAGDTVNVVLTPGFSGTIYTEYWKIWIDYNGDHDFEDAGEEVFSGYGSSTVSGSFTVQSGVDIVTRMRVSMKYAGYPTPCETFTYGEVEDYTADIGPGTQPPVADFEANYTTITEGDTVAFTDLSTGDPNAWDWTFEGGTPAASTEQHPMVTYYTAGNYTVTLTATNAYGSDTETKTNYITVEPLGQKPDADFTASATIICEGDSVTFTDISTNTPDAWSWTFEGGVPATSTQQNPTVTYNVAGTYTVTLTATNAYGSDTETKVDYITVIVCPPCIGEITNPGFETGSTSGWTVIGSTNITLDSHSGLYAIFIDGTNSSVEQVITDLCPNTTYTVSCWGKGKTPAGAYLGVKNYGGAEQTVQFTDFKNYAQKSITFTTGSTNTTATIFFIKTSNKFDGTADDFTIVKN